MEYSKLSKEQLIEEIGKREAEIEEIRQLSDAAQHLNPVEFRSLKWTYCRECGNRLVDTAGCNSCSAAKASYMSENGRE